VRRWYRALQEGSVQEGSVSKLQGSHEPTVASPRKSDLEVSSLRKSDQELEEEYRALQEERACLLQALKKKTDAKSPRGPGQSRSPRPSATNMTSPRATCQSRSPRQPCKKRSEAKRAMKGTQCRHEEQVHQSVMNFLNKLAQDRKNRRTEDCTPQRSARGGG